jgi:hypothetical protein
MGENFGTLRGHEDRSGVVLVDTGMWGKSHDHTNPQAAITHTHTNKVRNY